MVESIQGKLPDDLKNKVITDLNNLLESNGKSSIDFKKGVAKVEAPVDPAGPEASPTADSRRGVVV